MMRRMAGCAEPPGVRGVRGVDGVDGRLRVDVGILPEAPAPPAHALAYATAVLMVSTSPGCTFVLSNMRLSSPQ